MKSEEIISSIAIQNELAQGKALRSMVAQAATDASNL